MEDEKLNRFSNFKHSSFLNSFLFFILLLDHYMLHFAVSPFTQIHDFQMSKRRAVLRAKEQISKLEQMT